jgi:type IV pilus assembly protein PilC
MFFSYEAFTKQGEKAFGTINAQNKEEAAYILYQKDLIVSKISPVKEEKNIKVKEEELIVFTRLLGNAIEAHIPLTRGLEITVDELGDRSPLKAIVLSLLYEIKVGKAFYQALEIYPGVFNRFYVSMVKAGEKSGKLGQAFAQTLSYLMKRYEIKKKISSAMLYPSLILGFACLVLTFFVMVLIPRFQDSYMGFGGELPYFTQMLMGGTNWIKSHILWIIGFIVGLVFFIRYWIQTEKGRLMYEEVVFGIPVIGAIYQKDVVTRFSKTLSVLLNNGITLSEGLELTNGVVNNRNFEIVIHEAISSITNGKTFVSALKEKKHIPSVLVQMVAMGEESGRLGELLDHLSEFYEKDVDVSIEKITSVITPIMIIFIGLIIGFIVVGLFLHIFDISRMIK